MFWHLCGNQVHLPSSLTVTVCFHESQGKFSVFRMIGSAWTTTKWLLCKGKSWPLTISIKHLSFRFFFFATSKYFNNVK